MSEPDIHVNWHMTPGEWDELRGVLLRNTGYEYIGKLEAAGALGTALAAPHREPKPAPELAAAMAETRRYRELVASMLHAIDSDFTGITLEQIDGWRKRAGLTP